MDKKKKQKTAVKKEWKRGIFLAGFFLVYPLFMTKGYSNVSISKIACAGTLILIAFFWIMWEELADSIQRNKGFLWRKPLWLWKRMSVPDRFLAGFFLAELLAFLCSKYRDVSLDGRTDTHIGLFYMILMVMVYVVGRQRGQMDEKTIFFAGLGMDCVILFSLWQFLGGDPFGILSNLNTEYTNNYLSTFGNTAIFGMYLTLMMPLCICGYCRTDDIRMRIFTAASSGFGIIGVLISNTDATYLGFCCALAFSAMVFMGERKSAARLLELFGIDIVGIMLFRGMYHLAARARPLSSIVQKILGTPFWLWLLGLGILAVCWFLTRKMISSERFYRRLVIALRILVIAAGALALGAFVFFSVFDRTTELGGLERYLRFRPSWGTDRGYVWGWLANIFADAGIIQKLFGAGQGSVVLELFTHYTFEMTGELGYFFDNAHNVYLHYLITIGIFGCLMYIGLLISCLTAGFGRKQQSECGHSAGAAIAVAACVLHGIFHVLEPGTLPFLFLYLGMIASKSRRNREQLPKNP